MSSTTQQTEADDPVEILDSEVPPTILEVLAGFETEDVQDALRALDSLDSRDVRALTADMTVESRESDVFEVESGDNSYVVDRRTGRCLCPDTQYNLDDDEDCKHVKRVQFACGDRDIPAGVDPECIDPPLLERTQTVE